jgi:hypothetical protein
MGGASVDRAPEYDEDKASRLLPIRRLPVPQGEQSCKTQRVTAADLRKGRIRIPSSEASSTNSIFPEVKTKLTVKLRGETVQCSWDPRTGQDKVRSGELRVGTKLRELIKPDEVLTAARIDEVICID